MDDFRIQVRHTLRNFSALASHRFWIVFPANGGGEGVGGQRTVPHVPDVQRHPGAGQTAPQAERGLREPAEGSGGRLHQGRRWHAPPVLLSQPVRAAGVGSVVFFSCCCFLVCVFSPSSIVVDRCLCECVKCSEFICYAEYIASAVWKIFLILNYNYL